jgi:hypothetical protein
MSTARIKYIATAVREEFVEHVVKNDLKFRISDLGGACGICSYLVFRALKQAGYNPVFHMNDFHCFVTVNGYYIDLTLKQFAGGAEEVFFHRHPYRIESTSFGFVHRRGKTATTEGQLQKMFAGWFDENNPFQQKVPLPETLPLTKVNSVL